MGEDLEAAAASSEAVEIAIRLLDEAFQSWQAAQRRCTTALRRWAAAGPSERAEAHLAYRAALDHEEATAHDLQRLHELVYATT